MNQHEPGRNVYIGHRYVPLLIGEWDKSIAYEGLSIVTYKGASYTSKKRVPVGIEIENDEFWVLTGNYNAQVEYYRQETESVSDDLSQAKIDLNNRIDDETASARQYVDDETASARQYVDDETASARQYVDGEVAELTGYVDDEVEKNQEYVKNEVKKFILNINVKEFGAVGDGVSDDTIYINNAIDYVNSGGGGNVLIPSGTYMIKSDIDYDETHWENEGTPSGIIMKDNVNLIMSHDTFLKVIPNNNERYSLISVYNVNNVSISGGQLIGDRYDHYHNDSNQKWKMWEKNTNYQKGDFITSFHLGYEVTNSGTSGDKRPTHSGSGTNGSLTLNRVKDNVGEWGHGIAVTNSDTVYINDVTIKNFWGDGHLHNHGTSNLYVKNVHSHNNRRQGCSIISLYNAVFEGCTFTGSKGTLPESGVDIEPENHENRDISVSNVRFNNCKFNNNNSRGFVIDVQSYSLVTDIKMSNCVFKNNLSHQLVLTTNDGSLKNVLIEDSLIDKRNVNQWAEIATVTGGNIDNITDVQNIKFHNVDFYDSLDYKGTDDSARINIRDVTNISFEECEIFLRIPDNDYQDFGIFLRNVNNFNFDKSYVNGGNFAFKFHDELIVDNIKITNSNFKDQRNKFSTINNVGKLRIIGNNIEPLDYGGSAIIAVLKSSDLFITDNYIHSHGRYCYYIESGVLSAIAHTNIIKTSHSDPEYFNNVNYVKSNNLIYD